MNRRLKYGICFAGAALCFCVCLLVLKVWRGPCGNDIYYYALQTKALTLGGALLFSDHSLVYRALYLVNLVLKNPVLSAQILSSLSIALIYFCLLVAGFRFKVEQPSPAGPQGAGRGAFFYKIAAATIAVFNPGAFYLLLEFLKNSFAFALFFLAWLLLTGEDNRLSFNTKNLRSVTRLFIGLAVLAASVFSHRMMLVLFLCFFVHEIFIFLWPRLLAVKHGVQIALVCVIAAALATVAVCFFLRTMLLERLPAFSLSAPLHRFTQLYKGQLLSGEKFFYIIMHITVFFGVPFVIIKKKLSFKPELVFAVAAWFFLFPFLHFTWDGVGLRLLILAPVMLAPWIIQLKPRLPTVTALIFIAASLWFTTESALHLALVKGPDYPALRNDFNDIETLARGQRLIVHRGLAGFLWYEKGIRSENFLPTGSHEKYLRVVYAFSPEIFESYLEPGDPPPLTMSKTYTLIEEYIWQRFYQERRELYFLKSELNPWLPRPVSGFVINEKIAALLSPASTPP